MILAADNAVSISPVYGAIALAISLVLAASAGVFYPHTIIGPRRLSDDEPASNILAVMGFGLMGFAATILSFGYVIRALHIALPDGKPTAGEVVVLDCVLDLAVFVAIVTATALMRQEGIARMGLALDRLGWGIAGAFVGIIIVLPMTFFVNAWTQMLFNHLKIPIQEHDLLKIMGSMPQVWLRWAIVLAAVVFAPLAEETFFRGCIQTLLRYTTNSAWLSVIITSALFALVHDKFEWLPMFFLGLCLGYIYERTANLWMCIIIHALFNLTSIVIFWRYVMQGG
jgi:membrane protease YdiL (CAAX protease family)